MAIKSDELNPSLTNGVSGDALNAPDLESLEVMMELSPPLDEKRLLERFREALIEKLPRQALAEGATLEPDDIITFNTCAVVDGELVPFSTRLESQLVLEPLPHLPGFSEGIIAQATVGETLQLPLTLPPDYSVEGLRGKTAIFVVQVMSVERLVGIHDDDNFKALGFGDTLDQCMQHLVTLLDEDMGQALLLQAQDKVLRAFSAKVKMAVPSEWMEREIQALWKRSEEPALQHFGFDLKQCQRALQAWLDDDKTRSEVEHRLRLELGLAAIEQEHEVEVSDKALRALLYEVGKRAGIRSTEIRENMTAELHAQAERIARHRALVEYIMESATIRFPN